MVKVCISKSPKEAEKEAVTIPLNALAFSLDTAFMTKDWPAFPEAFLSVKFHTMYIYIKHKLERSFFFLTWAWSIEMPWTSYSQQLTIYSYLCVYCEVRIEIQPGNWNTDRISAIRVVLSQFYHRYTSRIIPHSSILWNIVISLIIVISSFVYTVMFVSFQYCNDIYAPLNHVK